MDDVNLYANNEKGMYSLAQTVGIFSDDIGREFGINKYATLALKREKITFIKKLIHLFYCLMEE